MMIVWRTGLLLAVLIAGACVPRRDPPAPEVRPQPPVQVAPRPQPPAPPPPAAADWRDLTLSPGGWVYSASGGTSEASFGPTAGPASFVVRCDRTRREVSLGREGANGARLMTVRSSFTARNLPVSSQVQPRPSVWALLPANDRLLDGIAFSRGRFTVEVPGMATLVIPSWPEPARVVEDCRG